MGEGVSGFVSATSGAVSLVITIEGKISLVCLNQLKLLVENWAQSCGVIIRSVTTLAKPPKPGRGSPKKKKKKKKKAKKK